MATCPDHATIQMMAHVVILPGRERAIKRRVDPGMTLAAGAVGPALFPLAVGLLLVFVAYGRWRLMPVHAK